jgi:hypothetical protein
MSESTYPGQPVKRGDHGGNVKKVQTQLNEERAKNPDDNKSQPKLTVDGDFGPNTEKRVKQFQGHHDGPHGNPLEVDGAVGRFTWASLFDEPLYQPPKDAHPAKGTLWLPRADRVLYASSGPFLSAPARGVLHTTEGRSLPNYGTGTAPQLTHSLETGRVWQHMPLNEAGKALEHNAGTIDTNRMHAIQIENIGFAALSAADWPDHYYENLAKLMRDLESACGIHRTDHGLDWTGSWHGMSDARWRAFDGWCGHQHAPHQYLRHWDPGAINAGKLGL